jgi:hypothetical protein
MPTVVLMLLSGEAVVENTAEQGPQSEAGRTRPGVSEAVEGKRTLSGCVYGDVVSGVLLAWP